MMAPANEKSTVKVNIDYHQHQGNGEAHFKRTLSEEIGVNDILERD